MTIYNGIQVNVGDTVVIEAQGLTVRGTVAVVEHWGKDYGWDMELDDCNVAGGYARWKQGTDGGRLVKVNGHDAVETQDAASMYQNLMTKILQRVIEITDCRNAMAPNIVSEIVYEMLNDNTEFDHDKIDRMAEMIESFVSELVVSKADSSLGYL